MPSSCSSSAVEPKTTERETPPRAQSENEADTTVAESRRRSRPQCAAKFQLLHAAWKECQRLMGELDVLRDECEESDRELDGV